MILTGVSTCEQTSCLSFIFSWAGDPETQKEPSMPAIVYMGNFANYTEL